MRFYQMEDKNYFVVVMECELMEHAELVGSCRMGNYVNHELIDNEINHIQVLVHIELKCKFIFQTDFFLNLLLMQILRQSSTVAKLFPFPPHPP